MSELDSAVAQILEGRRTSGRMLLALDFDGTLAPIVSRPDDATMPPAAAAALGRLARRRDTLVAIVSGRGLNDVRARVREARAFYAGNHGFEIEGPGVRHRLDAAERLRPELLAVSERLRHELEHVEGVDIEDKGVTLSVHYRRVADPAAADRVRDVTVREGERSGLRATHGKHIVELRPTIDWHKGRAVEFLLDTLGDESAPLYPVFIGDDVTDEDAFRAVRSRDGLAVLVADPAEMRDTAAGVRIDSPERLTRLLEALADAPEGTGERSRRTDG